MSTSSDAVREIMVARAVRAALTAVIERGAPVTDAVSAAVCAILEGDDKGSVRTFAPETPTERCRRENQQAMAIMDAADARGRSRDGASEAAKQIATDPSDPLELERLGQRFRRLRRTANICEHRSVGYETIA
jgi:hypothetical protein